MRIIHVYRDSYPPLHGGIEQHIHTLVHEQKRHISPTVLVSGTQPGTVDDAGVPIRSVGAWGRFQGAPLSPGFPAAIRSAGADLLHFHMSNPTGEIAYLVSGARAPAVATHHHDIVRQARALKLYRPVLSAFLERVARIIVATPYHITSSDILSPFREKCRVIPYGIEADRFAATQDVLEKARAIRSRYGPRIMLFVGKLRWYKGLDYLLRAVPQVEGRLLIVGKGVEEERLRVLANDLQLGDRVVWLQHLETDELLATLHACDVFVLPSSNKMEQFGIAQLEAHACGKPSVCTSLGTGVEYVNLHEQTGLVVPPADVAALAAALDRLLGDPGYARRLGEAARLRVYNEFTQERMGQAIRDLYSEVLNECR